jgi:hypothetical protein
VGQLKCATVWEKFGSRGFGGVGLIGRRLLDGVNN